MSELAAFKTLVREGVMKALEHDGGKPYEGAIEYVVRIPPVRDCEPDQHVLALHCYVLGPARHYEWKGEDAHTVFAVASADVRRWIADLEDES